MSTNSRTRAQRCVEARWKRLLGCKDEAISLESALRMGFYATKLDLEHPSSDFFEPLTDEYMQNYPVLTETVAAMESKQPEMYKVEEYNPETAEAAKVSESVLDRIAWSTSSRVQQITLVLKNLIYHLPRENTPQGTGPSLANFSIWCQACRPVPLSDAFYINDPPLTDRAAKIRLLFEVETYVYPHIIMLVEHYTPEPVTDHILLRHELAFLIRAMEIRLDEGCFPKDQPQPVLMVSLVGPQHGRIIQAHIDGTPRMVVAYSRLYSFEKNEGAPFDLFCRWLLANPVGVEPAQAKEK
ncbi:hypothetical protein BO70DRAFT_377762 [Aspergillus heteromorphus CBS 117.55]|uniref:Uncharacterized protein n=1 Tax=Aspergillus heteromorphus CBS 117.55 TaxID=1448321 RepID=A0A317WR71_9EURO|nr:uncharacterized protein BO70DRAFT_377762 [Aspergillus heteromorphus CBS 117.55]PWY88201.1 hypothetical protein BO70DRAFT_377762 [Aspergillus heteromorphus CBS 117.55]